MRYRLRCVLCILLAACTSSPAEVSPRPPGSLPFFVPRGLEVRAASLNEDRPQAALYQALIAKPNRDGTYREAIKISVSSAPEDRKVPESELRDVRLVPVAGVDARLLDQGLTGSQVDWFRDGLSVYVAGPAGMSREVVEAARGLRLPEEADPTGVSLHGLAAGYVIVGEHRIAPFTASSYSFISFRGSGAGRSSISLQVAQVPAGRVRPEAMLVGDDVSYRKIRGARAALSRRVRTFEWEGRPVKTETAMIAMLERPDVMITAQGTVSPDVLVRVLEGLEEVGRDEWRRRMPLPAPVRTTPRI